MTSAAGEKWYVAVLVFESKILESWSDPSVDVQYRLIRAADGESAYRSALGLGRREEHSYKNPDGETCVWSFKGLHDLQEVDSERLAHGTEICGFIEDASADEYVVPKEQLTLFLRG